MLTNEYLVAKISFDTAEPAASFQLTEFAFFSLRGELPAIFMIEDNAVLASPTAFSSPIQSENGPPSQRRDQFIFQI